MRDRYQHQAQRPRTRLHEILERGEFSEITRQKYRMILDQWIEFAGTHPNGWTRTRMEAWRDVLIARGLTEVTIDTYIASLRYVSKWFSTIDGGVDFTIIQPITIPNPVPEPRRPPTYEETTRLLSTCVDGQITALDHRDLTLMIVGFDTGMRRGSLAGMMFEKVGMLSRGPNGPYPSADVPVKGRGGKMRFKVPLSDVAMEAIESWQSVVGSKSGPVFRRIIRHNNQRGTRVDKITGQGISGTSIYKMMDARAKIAGIEHVHPHLMRHAFVTWRAIEGVDVWEIASVTGHAIDAFHLTRSQTRSHTAERYISVELAGERGRKTTPPWFGTLARRLLREVSR